MKAKQRFLIAKYASDIRRMEPRNIGIILWAGGRVACQFLPTSKATFVNDRSIYERWIAFWKTASEDTKIDTPRMGRVTRRQAEFLDAIKETASGNYLLFEGGHLLDEATKESINDAVKMLYEQLVLPVA